LEKYFEGQLKRLERRLSDHVVIKSVAARIAKKQAPDSAFWDEEADILYRVVFPLLLQTTTSTAQREFERMSSQTQLGVSWNLVNDSAYEWANNHTRRVVSQLTNTSMEGFLNEFEPWVVSGDPLPALIGSLQQYYSPARA